MLALVRMQNARIQSKPTINTGSFWTDGKLSHGKLEVDGMDTLSKIWKSTLGKSWNKLLLMVFSMLPKKLKLKILKLYVNWFGQKSTFQLCSKHYTKFRK